MKVLFIDKAKKELKEFDSRVQNKFYQMFRMVEKGIVLDHTKFKKLKGYDMFEFRVKLDSNIYRALGGYSGSDQLIVTFFQKKTQKTPERFINLAIKRLRIYI